MESLRPGVRYPPGSTSGIPSRRTDTPENSRLPFPSASGTRPNPSSRLPQTHIPFSNSRQPPRLQQPAHSRPPLTHQSQPWTSATGPSGLARPARSAVSPPPHPRSTRATSTAAPAPPAPGSNRIAIRPNPYHTISRAPSIEQGHLSKPYSRSRENGSTSSIRLPLSLDRGLPQSPAELRVASKAEAAGSHPAPIYPELDRYRHVQPTSGAAGNQGGRQHPDFLFRLATEGLPPPPTPYNSGSSSLASGISGSPSTRFSESPGPGSYSRDTTPTSISSYSPGVVTSTRTLTASKVRQNSRGRAGSFGTEVVGDTGGAGTSAHPLTAIRESLNSSSSSSNGTVRDGDKKSTRPKKKRLSPLPPSPPPRKSSQGFRMPTDTDKIPLAKPSQQERTTGPARPPVSSQTRKSVKPTVTPTPTSLPKPAPSGKPQIATASRPAPSRSTTLPAPPARPSRDGTPDLHSHFRFPFPVIHSNLATAQPPNQRESIGMALSSQASTILPQRHKRSTSILSFRDQQLQSPARPPTIRDQTTNRSSMFISETVSGPDSASGPANISVRVPRQDSRLSDSEDTGRKARTPSPSVSIFRTRFPLFGRRTRTTPVVNVTAAAEPREKLSRRGPAAGTGHEGYGRLGASRRRSNSAGTLSKGVSASQDNQGSTQVQDPFLRDRLSPVIISGGEVVLNKNTSLELSRTDSNTSSNFQRPSLDLRNSSQVSLSSHEDRSILWPSAMSRDGRLASSPQLSSHRPSDSTDSEVVLTHPTLAYRRSVQRLHSTSESQTHLPTPIVVRESPPGAPSSVNSLDTGILSDDSTIGSRSINERGIKEPVPVSVKAAPKKLTKRARSPRKWNMFGRSQSQPAASLKKGLESSSTVSVTVEAASSAQEKKPVAFYTMIDSSEQEDGDMDIEYVLREAHALPSPPPKPLDEQLGRALGNNMVSEEDLLLLPPPPLISILPEQQMGSHKDYQAIQQPQPQLISSPQAPSEKPPPSSFPQISTAQSERPSRLQQVGRIPKVVSARQEQLSPRSFSRPFNRASMQVPASLDIASRTNSAKDTLLLESTLQVNPASGSTEFLAFPPRHNSGTTTTSQSSGILTFADSTAIVPDPSAPLYEDEVWDEYNDLLGEDETAKIPLSPSSSHGLPFHLEGSVPLSVKAIARQIKLEDEGLESPTVVIHARNEAVGEATRQYARPAITSGVFDMAAQLHDAIDGRSEPPSGQLPPTPFSVSEFVSGYGDRSSGLNEEKKAAGRQRSSSSSQRSGPRKTRISDGSVYSQVSEDNSPTAQVNLRVGSMTVSKWLTFGHVLFSPARDDMVPAVSPPNGHSVLVIDGLGNDDWSFYAAETYPAATFFNMSPRAPLPVGHGNGANAFPMSPSNHHQIQYMFHADKFPFASEIFTTVVYRFPRAAPESHYRNIVSESRRVLKPGGYIELSILDLDMNNMGNRTRRAVRQLKERIHLQTPDVHLGSAADAILRLLGSKGYMDIKSCRVGVPAAKAIPRSSGEMSVNGTGGPVGAGKRKKDDRSLSEMISDQSPVADESITNMVARVGRWWHGKCYGDTAAVAKSSTGSTDSNASAKTDMWTDRAVLAECEAWGTNLKLMACYARVPDTKRVASI